MSVQLVLGGSGSGKSHCLYENIIKQSMEAPLEDFLIIVPEQYTMETQRKLVNMHPRHGIMNIDILSFQRLAYRIFEQTGGGNTPVLDDTGKNLIVRKVLENKKKELTVFSNSVNKTGFVSELKSVISEFLQYGIGVDEAISIENSIKDNQLLKGKIHDINLIYSCFKEYMQEKYITSEEILDVLCRVIEKSELIQNSTIAIDGFTGFTPIQYKLIAFLMKMAKKVYITVTIDGNEKINVLDGIQNLFFLSKDTISKIYSMADKEHVKIDESLIIKDSINYRFIGKAKEEGAEDIAFLEKNLFRYNNKKYKNTPANIDICAASNPKEEISYVAGMIKKLTADGKYRYKDIAVVSGDVNLYGDLADNIFSQNEISTFIDNKRSVIGNVLVEFIRSTLEIISEGYSYESVFRYLKTGLTDLAANDIDLLENYCLAMSIRGSKRWHDKWIRNSKDTRNKADLEQINNIREQFAGPIGRLEQELKQCERGDAHEYTACLYNFITDMKLEDKALEYSLYFESTGDKTRAGEYAQIYQLICSMLEKIIELLGNEKIGIREYAQILDSGFEEMKVALIPPSADSVLVGDIERTRLDNIKILFFVGVNDGIVPKKSESRGVLSEYDKDILASSDVILSPSPRQKAFIQKFYLYLNMTKPSQKLYISYSNSSMESKGISPSYIIHNLINLFPQISVYEIKDSNILKQYVKIPKTQLIWKVEDKVKSISADSAVGLYGEELYGSVTRLEQFAACEFAHFLKFGLMLEEREEYQLAARDIGNILHSVLEKISNKMQKDNISYRKLEAATRRALVQESVVQVTSDYGNTILMDSKKNEYMTKKLTDLADRTLWAIGKQIEHGEFEPDLFEVPFQLEKENLAGNARMVMHGKIDRIDICEDEQNVYVKVVDYKTSNQDFDLLSTYYGLKLQLISYMKAAIEIESKCHPNKKIVPAGMLYYNMDNPIVEKNNETDDDTKDRILEQLNTKGIVNSDNMIVRKFDNSEGKSKVVPVKYTKDGGIENTRNTISSIQFKELESYVENKMHNMAENIVKGSVEINPYKNGKRQACTYCQYNSVCGFYEDIPGLEYRKIKQFSDKELWEKICKGGSETNG